MASRVCIARVKGQVDQKDGSLLDSFKAIAARYATLNLSQLPSIGSGLMLFDLGLLCHVFGLVPCFSPRTVTRYRWFERYLDT